MRNFCYRAARKTYRKPRKNYCAGISCTCEPRFARALLRVSAQYLRRSLQFFVAPYSVARDDFFKFSEEHPCNFRPIFTEGKYHGGW